MSEILLAVSGFLFKRTIDTVLVYTALLHATTGHLYIATFLMILAIQPWSDERRGR